MRQLSKIVEIPQAATKTQMEASLDALIDKGWELVTVFNHNNKTYAVLKKVLVK